MDAARHLKNNGGYMLIEILIASVLGAFVYIGSVGAMHNLFEKFARDFRVSERPESIRTVQWLISVTEFSSDITVDGDGKGFTSRLDYTEVNNGTLVWEANNTPFDTSDDTFVRVKLTDDAKFHYLSQVGSAPAEPADSDPSVSSITAVGTLDPPETPVPFALSNSSGAGNSTELSIGVLMGSSPATEFATSVAARNMVK